MNDRNQKGLNSGYKQLNRKILFNIILPAFIPLFLVSGLILFQFSISYTKKVEEHLAEIVQKHKLNINTFLEERASNIQVIATTFDYNQLNNKDFLEKKLSILQQEFDQAFVDIGVVNADGIQKAYAGPYPLERTNYGQAPWFKEAIEHKSTISNVFLGKRGYPHFIVTARRFYQDRPWIFRATIDFGKFNTLVQKTTRGETGFSFILNREGKFQTQPVRDINPEKEPYKSMLNNLPLREGEVKVVRKQVQSGHENILVLAPLKGGDWVLVYQQRATEALSILYKSFLWGSIILVLGVLGIVTSAIIISRRMILRIKKVSEEKEAVNAQMIEAGKMAAVGELAAGIAHEINNPVAIMLEEAGWIEDLIQEEQLQNKENEKEIYRSLKEIANQGKRSKDITHKLLSFARKTDSTVREVNLQEMLKEIVGFTSQRAKYSSIEVKIDIDNNIPVVQASPTELQQVFLNMINNSVDAMEKSGGKLKISCKKEDGFVYVTFADNGPGIPPQDINRIFEPFYTTKPPGKGTGLGLSICYGIINKMGGDIFVKSEIGQGTTFTIKIPV